jgi:hypothetical protein
VWSITEFIEVTDDLGTWLTFAAVLVLSGLLLRNQFRGLMHLNRLHSSLARLELKFTQPQPRYMIALPGGLQNDDRGSGYSGKEWGREVGPNQTTNGSTNR